MVVLTNPKPEAAPRAIEPASTTANLTVYVDTNILLDDLYKRRADSRQMLRHLRTQKVPTVSSLWAYLEVLSQVQMTKYINNKLALGIQINQVYSNRHRRDLTPTELTDLWNAWYQEYELNYSEFITFYDLKVDGWKRVFEIARDTNLDSADCIHAGTALDAKCNIFVTHDEFLRKELDKLDVQKLGMVACTAQLFLDTFVTPPTPT